MVRSGCQQWGVVAVGPGQFAPERDAVALDQQGTFHALFASVDRRRSGDLAAARGFGDTPVDGDVFQQETDDAVVGLQYDLSELGEDTQLDPFIVGLRMVLAEQVVSAMPW
ncbi:hypothetical protein A8926_1705 [Saccharopolyspora spinosa]|uniref:Uncharacterized protein n=1 Tax=Saccharopolyspora spinosa TaxID=60894 RepID=A0A2N3XTY0_SACSN|nr:hypothetical protein A8926_1705 [Saccharopolyspora spinosa]